MIVIPPFPSPNDPQYWVKGDAFFTALFAAILSLANRLGKIDDDDFCFCRGYN